MTLDFAKRRKRFRLLHPEHRTDTSCSMTQLTHVDVLTFVGQRVHACILVMPDVVARVQPQFAIAHFFTDFVVYATPSLPAGGFGLGVSSSRGLPAPCSFRYSSAAFLA